MLICLPRSRVSGSSRRNGAFTIVEIIVVIVIIGVLATLIAPRLLGRIGQAKSSTALSNANVISQAVETFRADTGTLPSGPSLMFLMELPSDIDAAKWRGPYLKSVSQLKDPWERDFILIVPGVKNVDFDIVSYGADGNPGGEGENADVTNK